MSDLTPKGRRVNVDGVEREILFTISAIDDLQEHYDEKIDKIMSDYIKKSEDDTLGFMRQTAEMLTILINANAEADGKIEGGHFDRCITNKNAILICLEMLSEYGSDLPEPDGDESPNAESAETKN